MTPAAIVLVLLLGPATGKGPPPPAEDCAEPDELYDLSQAYMTRAAVDAREAGRLEDELARDADDAILRARLLGFYNAPARSAAPPLERLRHVLWFIANLPASRFTSSPFCAMSVYSHQEGFDRVSVAWRAAVQKHADGVEVLGNAARFYALHDPRQAETLLKKAQRLDPENDEWPAQLSHLYTLHADSGVLADPGPAKLAAFEQQAKALAAASAPAERFHLLGDTAVAGMNAGQFELAAGFAKEILAKATGFPGWQTENGVHQANLVLGHLALHDDHRTDAGRYLLAAGRVRGSPQLASFGPNMSLADRLLKLGERDVVIDYLSLCATFWKTHQGALDRWTADIRAGNEPEFGANLIYQGFD